MARVAVVGVGAIGAAVAAALQDTGRHELMLCARRPLELVVVAVPEGGEVALAGPFVTDPGAVGAVDWVLLAVKAHQTSGAAAWLRALCGAATTVAVLQNGVDHVERVGPLARPAAVLPVVNWCRG